MTVSHRISTPAVQTANIVNLNTRVPERLVGVGFRCWLMGFTTGNIGLWEEAFNAFSTTLGTERTKLLLVELSQFVRAVSTTTAREIEVQEMGCRGFCPDECLAISIIAACQHNARSTLAASAAALLGSDAIGDTLASAQVFACGMRSANQLLSAESVCPAACALNISYRRLM